jgi:ribosomal-protein-alanine N-acetyltransferase
MPSAMEMPADATANAVPMLETARLVLRPITTADAPALLSLFGDKDVTRFYDLETFTSVEQAEALVQKLAAVHEAGRGRRWGMQPKTETELVGTVGFNEWARAARRGGLGYDLRSTHWGRGLVAEALLAILKYGFEEMDLNRVEAFVMRGNERSMKLLRKLGFSEEGVLRERGAWKGGFHDLTLFSLLKSEYVARERG